ncbi:MAG: hypothetical protein ACM31C_33995 [Acidobacteriota bacterium]
MTIVGRTIACICVLGTAACLGPQASDTITGTGSKNILPAGATVPSIADNAELVSQIRLNLGISGSLLAMTGNVVPRSTGKAGGASVKYWSFGPVPIESGFAVAAPLYVLVTDNGDGTYTPIAEHPPLIDTICGDVRYSPIRRVTYVPVTDKYAGQLFPSVEALSDADAAGLIDTPVAAGTWVNMPVVLPGMQLEVATGTNAPTTQVFGRGYKVDVFELGTLYGPQPLRNNLVPVGQASSLQSGVATGTPPVLPTAFDPQPVFQFAAPAGPPTMAPNYTPIATEVDVRLASGIAPSAITSDGDLFARSASGAITGYSATNVASFTVTTTVTDRQVQFAEGSP